MANKTGHFGDILSQSRKWFGLRNNLRYGRKQIVALIGDKKTAPIGKFALLNLSDEPWYLSLFSLRAGNTPSLALSELGQKLSTSTEGEKPVRLTPKVPN